MSVGNKRTITKTRRKTRDVDQIKADLLSSRHLNHFKDSKAIEDLPGFGRNYCVECARWFDKESTLNVHYRGKPHKRRVKQLRAEPCPDPRRVVGALDEPQTIDSEPCDENADVSAGSTTMET